MTGKPTTLSLFAGVGGFCYGLQQAGFEVVAANEVNKPAATTYQHNFTHPLVVKDIWQALDEIERAGQKRPASRLDATTKDSASPSVLLSKPITLLSGGFPCQAFSVEGYGKGFNDKRGQLFYAFIKYIELHQAHFGVKPKALLLENVKNLKRHDSGRTFATIVSTLEAYGYTVYTHVFNTLHYSDLAQNRERIYIIAFHGPHSFNLDALKALAREPSEAELRARVEAVLDEHVADKYLYTKEKYPAFFANYHLAEIATDEHVFYTRRRGYIIRKSKVGVCPTLMAVSGTGGHNVPLIVQDGVIRKLTPAEYFKLQGFPLGDGFELPSKLNGRPYPDSQLYKQAGNAVSVPVVRTIGQHIKAALTG